MSTNLKEITPPATKDDKEVLKPFIPARKHANQTKKGIKILLSAPVALGAELLRLKAEIDPKKGRPKKRATEELPISENLPWKELVARETGFSWEWCRRSMVAAERVMQRLSESKVAGEKEAAKLLQNPPAEWSEEDYRGLSDLVGAVLDVQTFTELLLELKVVRPTGPAIGTGQGKDDDGKKKKKIPQKQQARDYFRNFRDALAADRENTALYRRRLKYLDVTTDDPKETCLEDLRVELKTHSEMVEAEIKRRESKG